MEKYCPNCRKVFKNTNHSICPHCRTRLNERVGRQPIPRKLRHAVFQRDGYRCRECGATNKETTLEIDHIIPVAEGGTNDIDNLQTLCKKCNRSKYTDTWVGGELSHNTRTIRNNSNYNSLHSLNKKQREINLKKHNEMKKRNNSNYNSLHSLNKKQREINLKKHNEMKKIKTKHSKKYKTSFDILLENRKDELTEYLLTKTDDSTLINTINQQINDYTLFTTKTKIRKQVLKYKKEKEELKLNEYLLTQTNDSTLINTINQQINNRIITTKTQIQKQIEKHENEKKELKEYLLTQTNNKDIENKIIELINNNTITTTTQIDRQINAEKQEILKEYLLTQTNDSTLINTINQQINNRIITTKTQIQKQIEKENKMSIIKKIKLKFNFFS